MHRSECKIANGVRNEGQQNSINRFHAERMHIELFFQKKDADDIINRVRN